MEQRIGSFFHPLSHFYYPSKGHGLTLEDLKWSSSLCFHPTPLALSQTLQLRSPNPGPGLWSQTRRRKRPGFLPGPRRAQRLDCSCRSGGISGQPRVKQRCRHLTRHTRRLHLTPEVVLLLGPPPSRKTSVRATAFSQSGTPRGESWVTSAG